LACEISYFADFWRFGLGGKIRYMNQAITRGLARANVQPGSVTFIQRFGSAINLHLHFHVIFLEGVYVDRTV